MNVFLGQEQTDVEITLEVEEDPEILKNETSSESVMSCHEDQEGGNAIAQHLEGAKQEDDHRKSDAEDGDQDLDGLCG